MKLEPSKIAALIDDMEGGKFVGEASSTLSSLARETFRQARNCGKAVGELKIKIRLEADLGGSMRIIGTIDDKYPRAVRVNTVRYQGSDGELTTIDPKQQDLFESRGAPVPVEDTRGPAHHVTSRKGG